MNVTVCNNYNIVPLDHEAHGGKGTALVALDTYHVMFCVLLNMIFGCTVHQTIARHPLDFAWNLVKRRLVTRYEPDLSLVCCIFMALFILTIFLMQCQRVYQHHSIGWISSPSPKLHYDFFKYRQYNEESEEVIKYTPRLRQRTKPGTKSHRKGQGRNWNLATGWCWDSSRGHRDPTVRRFLCETWRLV